MRYWIIFGFLTFVFVSLLISEVEGRRGGGRARISRRSYYRTARYEYEESREYNDNSDGDSSGLSVGAIVAIVIACLLVAGATIFFVVFFCAR